MVLEASVDKLWGGSLISNRRRLVKVLGIAVCLFVSTVCIDVRAGSLETIQGKIAAALKRPGIRSTDWGMEIIDPKNKTVLVSVNPDKLFKPASVLKVVTTAAALEKLGPDFRFRTGVYTNGTITADGTLVGDLILVGRGDPNLIDPVGDLLEKPALEELAEKLAGLGIRRIRGEVIGDDSYFESASHSKGWTAQDLKSVYGAQSTALSINNNVFWVHARPTKLNQRVTVSLEPHTSYFKVRNLGITGGVRSRRTLFARVIPGTSTVVVSGVLPARSGHGQYLLLENPAEVVAALLKEQVQARGIVVDGNVAALHRGDASPEVSRRWKLLAEHLSPPLVKAVEIINKRSQNLHAEMLLRTLGAEFGGVGSDEAGLKAVRDFLVEAGIESDRISLNDGCGLSRDNLVTPRFQTSLLLYLSTRPHFDLFLNTLAVSGTDGTLRHRLASEPLKGTIHAKTGTLNGVATLSGYMTTKSGRNLIFSIFANNANASMGRVRKTIDEICALFINLY
ncbi:MAG: D-alanyl-D-alanine carboxypeptidase/D-alanyl-D-alanine-endopeptidase [Acidobacteria bacterium]|nr:MAG: D-alanyl-D-alanine carboxypeptidase/D-alanyl-D-alanine-endopeptidase [Acidobacteriota bacterium]